ncbi:MAG: transcription termination/antitermination factor NusG [Clostridiales bacterium]|nr:transcription termination/antitermination factor NusG [Clostridiales bacterium]
MINENKEPRWYVVHTYSGYENKVKTNLEKIIENRGLSDLIMDVRIPLETVVETTASGETKTTEHKLFPAYVLVKMIMSDETWHVVRNITGATGFVGPGSSPVPLTDKEVEALGVEAERQKDLSFAVGSSVKIIGGPMAGFSGTVQEISADSKKVTVNASVFGRITPVELDAVNVEPEKI